MIRDFEDRDVEGVVQLENEIYPYWVNTVAGFRHLLATALPRAQRRRWVAEEDGSVVGTATGRFETYVGKPGVAYVAVAVDPAWRRRGLGSALYERVYAHLIEHGARRLLAESAADDGSRAFAEAHGFRHTMTRRLSALDPRTVDRRELRDLRTAKEREGYVLAPFSALDAHAVFEVDAAASRDIPLDEPMTDFRFEEWEQDHWRHPDLALEGSYAVLADGKPVSFAMLRADPAAGRAANDMTGTLREFRGRGLARLAKLATVVWAADAGITTIATENDETNAPMLALNVSLGYRPVSSLLAYVRDL